MCGIAGVIGTRAVSAGTLEQMASRMAHRGPDGSGLWRSADSRQALAHRRLAIVDLSDAALQPMWHRSGSLGIVFNGEIYNYVELREELRAAGCVFDTASDTEVLLEAYEHWGEAFLQRLNGMFAFALLDLRRRQLICARDRYGEKPFLYAAGAGWFAFASEYRALLGIAEVDATVDTFRLLQGAYRQGSGLDEGPETVWAGIRQLRPAEAMRVSLDTLAESRWIWWTPTREVAADRLSFGDAVERFRWLLGDSVRIRMRSDVPVGSCLSGGLDSGTIVGLARGLLGDSADYQTFTGRFPGTPQDEWASAELVVRQHRTTAHTVAPTGAGLAAEFDAFVSANELPVGSASQYGQYCVFRLAREQGVTVLLDGQGSDELLGGYEQYFAEYIATLRARGDGRRASAEIPQIRERYPAALVPWTRTVRDKIPFAVRARIARSTGRGSSLLFGLEPSLAQRVAHESERRLDPSWPLLQAALRDESLGRFLTTLLRYGDRNSMAHSLEVRLPFCDHRLAEFAWALPADFLMGDIQTKRLLRESTRGLLPEAIRSRWKKQGFLPPQTLWMQQTLLPMAEEALNDSVFSDDASWDHRWWAKKLQRARVGDAAAAHLLWQPLMLVRWRRAVALPFAAPSARRSAFSAA